jgi:predicted dehydrogenase
MMSIEKLKIGVLGTGHLGKIHLKCLGLLPDRFEIVGFCDPNPENAQAAIDTFGLQQFAGLEEMLKEVDAVDIVTPTITHFELGQQVLKAGKHLFIEKPVTHTVAEAAELLRLSREGNLKVQVGHVERFNPALLSVEDLSLHPMFIEAHRLAMFNPRGTDVSVVLDLMIHDLDIILSLVDSPISNVHASGVAVLSDTPDICNARIEFANGAVANLTASRMSLKQMRKLRLFQKDAYISLDFLEKNAQVIRMFQEGEPYPERGQAMELPTPTGNKIIHIDLPEIEPVNAIKMELETFADAIQNDRAVPVPLEDGYRALELAHRINDLVEKSTADFMQS